MMKTIVLVRHAKSSWAEPHLSDRERPLNPRGKRDAPVMAARLKRILPKLDLIVSSDANRALSTAKIFHEAYAGKPNFEVSDLLYHANPQTILSKISSLDEAYDKVAFFGHNPGFTALLYYFTQDKHQHMPTAAFLMAQMEVTSWAEVSDKTVSNFYFDFPKNDQS